MATKAPVLTEALVETEAPVLTEAPMATEAPVSLKDLAINSDTKDYLEDSLTLPEVELQLPNETDDRLSLKKPNEVYMEIYKEVKRRARVAKQQALTAILEVKRIKALYMLEETDNSSDEEDTDFSNEELNLSQND